MKLRRVIQERDFRSRLPHQGSRCEEGGRQRLVAVAPDVRVSLVHPSLALHVLVGVVGGQMVLGKKS